jgi:hypothetical protein
MTKNMNKKILILLTALITVSCQNNIDNTGSTAKPTATAIPSAAASASSTATGVTDLVLADFPVETGTVISKDQESDLTSYVQKNNSKIFSFIPTDPEYIVKFTGDGAPVFLTGDGSPVFSTKSTGSSDEYIWSRKPGAVLIDYLQTTQSSQQGAEITSYAKYSRLIEHTISVKGTINTEKTVKLVKTMGFVLKQSNNSYRLESITPVITRQVNPSTSPYQVRSLTLSSDKNKIIIYGDQKLFPMPGISLKNNLGSHKFKLYVEVVYGQDNKPDDLAVLVSINNKQFQLQKSLGNVYGAEVEFPTLDAATGLIIELIDKKSLMQDEEYHGFTWVVPMTD